MASARTCAISATPKSRGKSLVDPVCEVLIASPQAVRYFFADAAVDEDA